MSVLTESEALVDKAEDLIVVQIVAGKAVWVSPSIGRVLGWSAAEALRNGLSCLGCPDNEAMPAVSPHIDDGGLSTGPWECRCVAKSGAERWLKWSPFTCPATGGTFIAGRDVTEIYELRKRLEKVEEMSRIREAEMEQVLSHTRCLLWQAEVWDRGDSLEWSTYVRNGAAAEQFLPIAIPPGEDYSGGFYHAKLPEETERMGLLSETALRSGQRGYQQEYRLRLANGEIRWVFEDVGIEAVGEGHWKLSGVCTDITERKQAQEEMSRVLSTARCLLFQCDVVERNGTAEWITAEIRNLEGAQQFLPVLVPEGQSYVDAFHRAKFPEDAERMALHSERAILTGEPGYQQEYRVRQADGEIRWLSEDVSIQPIEPGRWRLTGVCTDITDRKNAEVETSQILSSAHCLLWRADVREVAGNFEWDLEFRNPKAAQQFLPVEIPPGGTYSDGFFLARTDYHTAALDKLSSATLRSGKSGYQQEYPVRTANGEVRWLSEDVHVERLGEGHWSLTGVCTDVTRQRQAEEEISQVLTSARCMLWQADVVTEGEGLHWETEVRNPESVKRFLPIEVPPGTTYAEAFHMAKLPEDAARMLPQTQAAIFAGQTNLQYEFRIRLANGEIRWLYEDVTVETVGPDHWRLTGVCADITDRKIGEEALRRSEARYERIAANVPGVVTQMLQHPDGSFDVTYVNQACYGMFGRPPEDYVQDASLVLETIYPDDRANFIEVFAAGSENVAPWKWEGRCIVSSGDLIWIEATARPELQPNGDILWDCLLMDVTARKDMEEIMQLAQNELQSRFHDRTRDLRHANVALQDEIAERKLAEEALLLAKEEAERANLAKSEFLSRMSHELRTPLNAILGFGQILEREDLGALQKESVQYILKGGRHLLDLINEVLDLAKVEAGRTDLSIEPVSVAIVLQEALDLVMTLAEEHSVRLIVDEAAIRSCHVRADQQRLKQVLINLLSNGIKYNRSGGTVAILCKRDADQVRIEVADTGIGIAPDDVGKLFTPFERLTANNSTVEGTGLGLALSQRLVGLMGGTLEVRSIPGVGSTFSIVLPPADAPIKSLDPLALSPDLTASIDGVEKNRSVLCIEDNLSNLRLMEVVLASRPRVELLSAMQGSVGLDLARRLRPDLILLDLNLPDVSGQEVLEQLRRWKETEDIPVIVISADAMPTRMDRLMKTGADAYLTKPLDVAAFLSALDKFLSGDNEKRS